METPVAVAFITGGFSVVVALIGKLMRDNKRDHGLVLWKLRRIERKLDEHVSDPAKHS